jgi:hypothetical protein
MPAQDMGTVAGVAQPIDETLGAVCTIDQPRLDPGDRLEQFVVIGMIARQCFLRIFERSEI